MVTRRCTQRQFLLRPDRETNNAFVYCLGVAAQRHQIEVIDFVQMSNHLHDALYDRHGNAPAFYEDFHKLLAKCMNALRGRWENFFSSEQVCVVRLENTDDLVDKLAYIATNPVKDGLVERVEQWPGASGHRALTTGASLCATRPKHFFAENGTMPAEVHLELMIPPELGNHDQIVAEVQRRVATIETEQAHERARTGKRVLGRSAVLRQSWRETPTSREPRRNLRPTIAARSLWARLEAIQRKREFVVAYRNARLALITGAPFAFPHGTYWLRRFMRVDVAPPEKMN
jgi:putative transposase